MSGSSPNVFGTGPVAASRFASPWVKVGIAAAVGLGLIVAYVLLSNQASTMFTHQATPPTPPPADGGGTNTVPFRPMPPAPRVAPVAPAPAPTERPVATPPSIPALSKIARLQPSDAETAGINSKITADEGHYPATPTAASAAAGGADVSETTPSGPKSALDAELTPTRFTASAVTELPHPDYLIEKGRSLPCTQMSIINTTYAGSVTAIIPKEIRGETGDIRLLGPGSKLFGTIEHAITNGADQAFVLWQDITTPIIRDHEGVPHQFRVTVDSPAASDLGETGLDGELNRHLGQKIGAVIGVSALQSGSQGLANSLQNNGTGNTNTTLNFNQVQQGTNTAGQLLAQQFVSIPDVLRRLQGGACTVELVRDLDLQAAYPKLKRLLVMQGLS